MPVSLLPVKGVATLVVCCLAGGPLCSFGFGPIFLFVGWLAGSFDWFGWLFVRGPLWLVGRWLAGRFHWLSGGGRAKLIGLIFRWRATLLGFWLWQAFHCDWFAVGGQATLIGCWLAGGPL